MEAEMTGIIEKPAELCHQQLIQQFFSTYPPDVLNQKLVHHYQPSLHHLAQADYHLAEETLFYSDLQEVLKSAKQLSEQPMERILMQPSFTELTLVCMEGVINLIKQVIPVGVIYNLSKSTTELDLIVVLERSCCTPYEEFESMIDLATLGYQNGVCTIHNYGLLRALIHKGHIFYATACVKENIVYQKDEEEVLTFFDAAVFENAKETAIAVFANGMLKATNFYTGAQHFLSNGTNDMAIFMLQQACELTYRCLLNVLRGKDVKCHSPAVLRKHVRRFAPEVIGVFDATEAEELAYLAILEEAYVKSRYQAHYTVAAELVQFLYERVGLLQLQTVAVMNQRIAVLDHTLNTAMVKNQKQ